MRLSHHLIVLLNCAACCATGVLPGAAPAPAEFSSPALAFEELAPWIGATAGSEDSKEGMQSLDWKDTVEVQRLRYRNARLDVSAYDTLTFWAHSEVANGAVLALVLISDNPETEDEDNLRYNFRVDWTGWKLHTVPFSAFKAVREPVGPSKVDHIVFASSKYACGEPLADTHIKLDDLRFVSSTSKRAADAVTTEAPTGKVEWVAFDGAAVARSVANDGRALVYFRSDMPMCKEFEKAYLLTPETNKALAGHTLYFADPLKNSLVAGQFRVSKVPTLMILTPDGGQESLSVNVNTTPESIMEFLARMPKTAGMASAKQAGEGVAP
ncbi:hypothetical protein GC173_09780 [bacterium]|nr:hypothetical protein [bacterium]